MRLIKHDEMAFQLFLYRELFLCFFLSSCIKDILLTRLKQKTITASDVHIYIRESFGKHLVILYIVPRGIFDVDFLSRAATENSLPDVSRRPEKEINRIPLDISDTPGDFDALHTRTYSFAWFPHMLHILYKYLAYNAARI